MEGFADHRVKEVRIMGGCVCVEVKDSGVLKGYQQFAYERGIRQYQIRHKTVAGPAKSRRHLIEDQQHTVPNYRVFCRGIWITAFSPIPEVLLWKWR